MKYTILLICCIFLFDIEAQSQEKEGTLALIVAENQSVNGIAEATDIVRYRFRNGELVSRDVIMSLSTDNVRFDLGTNQLYQNRYVINTWGDVIDVRKKKLLHRAGSGVELQGTEGDQVILIKDNLFDVDTHFIYDLRSKTYSRFKSPSKWALPGKLSPDGTKSASWSHPGGGNELFLNTLGGKRSSLGTGFRGVGCGEFSCPIVFWLDNDRILTTRQPGNIVILKLDGTIESIIDIKSVRPVSEYAKYCSIYRDPQGALVYECDGSAFEINVNEKSYSSYDWQAVGNDFDMERMSDPTYGVIIRYQGSEIGRWWCSSADARTIDGHIAVEYGEVGSNLGYTKGIKVWSARAKKWKTIDVKWLEDVIGWIEE